MQRFEWTSNIKPNIFVLHLVGFWPNTNQEYGLNIYTLHAAITMIVFGLSQALLQIVLMLNNFDDLQIVIGTAFLSISSLLVNVKLFYLARNMETFKELLVKINEDMFQPRNLEQVKMILPGFRTWKFLYCVLWGSAIVAIVFWTVVPFIDGSIKNRYLPFISWYPYDEKASPYYEITYLHQTLSIAFLTGANANLDSLIAAFMMYSAEQLHILSDNLENIHPDHFKEELVAAVNHHRHIVKIAKTFNFVFNWTLLVQFFASAISIGFSMFLISTASPLHKEFYSMMAYNISAFSEILIYCWFGNEVRARSETVPVRVFKSNWIDASKSAKKDLGFFMMVVQRPLKISALNLFDFSLENFLKIMKTAWSYYALATTMSR